MRTVRVNNKSLQVSSQQPEDYWNWVEQGCYSREFSAYDLFLKPEHLLIDVGAWVGGHTLYASDVVKGIIAVEPDPVAYEILNVNRPTNAQTLRKAISDEAGVVKLGSGFLGASTTRLNPKAGSGIGPWEEGLTFDVECITLRELIKDLPDPLFIKIDCEGAEERIFRDAALFEERKPVVLVELHPWWWEDETRALNDFHEVKNLYRNPIELFHNTWVLND